MARYTLEISQLYRNQKAPGSTFKVFPDTYDFYTTDPVIKAKFEEKFIEYYMFNEIGCETIYRWKTMLRGRLNSIMPYYKQLYETQLRVIATNFMIDRDITDDTDISTDTSGTNSSDNTSKTTSTDTGSDTGTNITLDSDTPHGSIENIENYISSAEKATSLSSNTSNSETDNTASSSSEQSSKIDTTHTTNSKGLTGGVSQAKLLEAWRGTLLNIDLQIISECENLFMQIF